MKTTEESKVIITVEGKKYESKYLRLDNVDIGKESIKILGGRMCFIFNTIEEYSIFQNHLEELEKTNRYEDINIEFSIFNKITLIPKKVNNNYFIEMCINNIYIRDNKIIANVDFSSRIEFEIK